MSVGVYKYVNHDGEIIYIGKTDSTNGYKQRIARHSRETKFQPWLNSCSIYVCDCANTTEAKLIESCLINKYKPILNVTDKRKGNTSKIKIDTLNWEAWDLYKNQAKEPKTCNYFSKPNGDYYHLDLVIRKTKRGPLNHPVITPEIKVNYKEYITVMADIYGMSITKYLHKLIEEDMKKNKEIFNRFSKGLD
jgi:hypothetical protein